ncbi:lipid-A-disaccharide synthase [Devosia sp.]|uniref:lipid-A-disaccharide synthase n=1 Tax=Devosia sp. TaxID=1871048 RepID=UPI001AC55C55|nr:lipid-A-disaccharide synthase [Devosia sp.]MBN9333250.1 lipid-A-disaccharide synthase [Devosia sp.]
MTSALRLFVLAGEPSGDRIAADLVRRLRERNPVEVSGVGGEALAASGLKSLFDMNELSVMGWADVLPRLPKLLWRSRQVARHIVKARPDVVVLVDSQVFSEIVAKQVYKAAPDIPVLLCVAPAAWAWKPERAQHLNPHFREVMAVLPFEPAFMRGAGGPETHYVGHPAVNALSFRADIPEHGPVLLLPGSRDGELRRHLPLMQEIAQKLSSHPRVTGFILPTPRRLEASLKERVADWPVDIQVVSGEERKASAMSAAIAAVAVTGTVTLELALAGVPMVTTYVADKGQAKRWFKYKVKFASLPNIILGQALVPEILQLEPDPDALVAAAKALLDGSEAADAQVAGFATISRLMEAGTPEDPRVDPAERVLNYWPSK